MIKTVLPPGVVSVEAFDDAPGEKPFTGEGDLVAASGEERRREFVTARRCAREALVQLGHAPAPIRAGPRREPRWPPGVVGSITHCTGYRAAAVAHGAAIASIGVDAEMLAPLPNGVLDVVSTADETELLRRLARTHPSTPWDRLLFSAKESVYKAWYPLTIRWLGFKDARLSIDPATGSFVAHLLVDGTRSDGGPPLTEMRGRYTTGCGLVVTAVTIHPGTEAADR